MDARVVVEREPDEPIHVDRELTMVAIGVPGCTKPL
jgi:hypothetical protein